jgi:hypothetical protein
MKLSEAERGILMRAILIRANIFSPNCVRFSFFENYSNVKILIDNLID